MKEALTQLRENAATLDANDNLKSFRSQFHIPKDKHGKDCIYLCGNSLGLQPKNARAFVEQELDDWQKLGVEGHFHGKNPWLPYHEFLTTNLAHVVGAKGIEVVSMNTLTVNNHLMFVSFFRPTKTRFKILAGWHTFPSDRYAIESQLKFHGLNVEQALIELSPRAHEKVIRIEDIEAILEKEGESIALVFLEGLNYYSGQALDLATITRLAHKCGAYVGFDLAHAAGNLALNLHDAGPDFATWCSYKYLNGGPGCVAGCFIHERHANQKDIPRFAGWWGNNKKTRFLMKPEFEVMPGAEGWQLSNPPILPLACLRASLDLFKQAGMNNLREKSIKLTSFLQNALDELLLDKVELITPRTEEQRGCQMSLVVKGRGREVLTKLNESGVICDFREPDVIRIAAVPLYNTFNDVCEFVRILHGIL